MRKLLVITCLIAGSCIAAENIIPLTAPPDGRYVTVDLEALANDQQGVALPARQVAVKQIPFELVSKKGANNLFLHEAGWPDWQQDPSSIYAEYDTVPTTATPRRPVVQIPVADYACAYLLAATDPDTNLSAVVSFRIGAIRGGQRVTYHDFSTTVPRIGEKSSTSVGSNLFLVRVPLGEAFAQDFKNEWTLDVEVTKELRLAIRRPDPCRFTIRPLGLPSGVRIYGLTFERAPLQMEVTSDEAGHVFNEPQVPTFHVTLRNPTSGRVTCTVEGAATDYYGNTITNTITGVVVGPGRSTQVDLPMTAVRRGYHELAVSLKIGKTVFLRRETTFALLPADTRKYRNESPFGVWDFRGAHYTPDNPDLTGPLYVKAGLRYGMFSYAPCPTPEQIKYGVLRGNDLTARGNATNVAALIAAEAALRKTNSCALPVERWMIFHETAISGPHLMRTPDMFTGRPPYQFSAAEQKTFDELWKFAEASAKAIRQDFPEAEIYFGNGFVNLLEEFVRRKFPKELLGSRGNESMSNMRLPETQPLDGIANNAGLWMDRQVLDHYGYKDTPLRQCYEVCYANTNPGNLSLRTQAAYYVRHIMHSMAWGIPIFRPSIIVDPGNSYYFSNWGASGLCQAMPDIRPKPSYVAFATVTLLLDGAKFTRVIPTDSPTVYAVEFQRRDKQFVTCLWTIRGTRELTVGVRAVPTLTDIMGNTNELPVAGEAAKVEISAEPVFLTTEAPLTEITAGPAVLEGRPPGKNFVISSLSSLGEWTVETAPNRELEYYNFLCPRRQGDFAYRETATFEGETNVLEIRPKLPAPGPVYLPMYSVLKHSKGVEIPGRPTEIGLMVNGNGGWGRIIFELEDASGQRWTSIGAEQSGEPTRWMADWMSPAEFKKLKSTNMNDWNTDDVWGRSAINFEGWRYVRFPLPGNYPGEGYHWPYSSQWRYSGDGVVKYPLKFKKLIVTIPEKVLKFQDYAPVARQEIYLKDLMVTYAPPEQAFPAE